MSDPHARDPPFVDAKDNIPMLGDEGNNGADKTPGMVEMSKLLVTEDSTLDKRTIRLTPKGQEYQCSQAKAECSRLLKRLSRQEKLMNILMESVDNKEKLEHDVNEYDKIFNDLVGAYTRYIDLNESEEEKASARQSLDELDSSIFDFKERIYTWMSSIKEPSVCSSHSSRHSSAASKHSRQSKSSKESKSSSRSRLSSPRKTSSNKSINSVASNGSQKSYIDFRADAAGLKAELSVVKLRREAELKAEVLEYEQKIQKAEAMERVYLEREQVINDDRRKEKESRKRNRKDNTEDENKVEEGKKEESKEERG